MGLFNWRSKKNEKNSNSDGIPKRPGVLKKENYDIDNAPTEPRGEEELIAEPIGETSDYIIYNIYYSSYRVKRRKDGVLFRRSKKDPSDLRYLIGKDNFSCVFHDYVLQCKKTDVRDFFVWGVDIETGQDAFFHWFSNDYVYIVNAFI